MKKARCKKYFPFQNWWSLTYGQVYIYLIVSINLVSQITLRSSGTDILYGCHLLRSLYNILYFLWLYNEFFIILCNILKIAELDCCQYHNIKYICTIYTRLDTCLMFTSRFSLRDKVTLRLLKLHFYGADVVEFSRALDVRLIDWCCSVSMVWVQIPSREEQNLTAQKSNSDTVWFNFQTSQYIYVYCTCFRRLMVVRTLKTKDY
jgi:hypothetical protein